MKERNLKKSFIMEKTDRLLPAGVFHSTSIFVKNSMMATVISNGSTQLVVTSNYPATRTRYNY